MKTTRSLTLLLLALSLAVDSSAAAQEQARSLICDGLVFEFVRIAPGDFLMGSENGDGDEKPVHSVKLDYSFDMSRAEVTVGQFREFVKASGYKTDAEKHNWAWLCPQPHLMGPDRGLSWREPGFEQSDDEPAVCISYNDAKAFCEWLSGRTSSHIRLPSEAEWEYACRASGDDEQSGNMSQAAWFDVTADGKPHAVAQRKPNGWGLYDMHGNAAEWCEDVYHFGYSRAPADGSARLDEYVPVPVASRRVLRGGMWCSSAYQIRCCYRYAAHRAFRSCGTGFRIVRCDRPGPTHKAVPDRIRKQDKQTITGTEGPKAVTLSAEGVDFEFVLVGPGRFMMGSMADKEEQPIHEVNIAYSFYMGKTEVTCEQFGLFADETGYVTDAEKQLWAFMRTTTSDWFARPAVSWRDPGFVQLDNEPATCISWYDAIEFCKWLSEKTGRVIRLPSEAEWEYTCRAGTTGDFAGPVADMAWDRFNSGVRTMPVGKKKPNAWGLYDMHGNVWEWVLDMWHDGYNGAPTDGSAWVEADIFIPVMRGGSFTNPKWWLRSANHMRNDPGCRFSYNHGFRLVMETGE